VQVKVKQKSLFSDALWKFTEFYQSV